MSSLNPNKGFTLIELLVTTALGMVMLAGVLAAYANLAKRQARSESAKDVITLLRVAQNRSRSGDKPDTGCTNLEGYRVYGSLNTQDYYLVVRCDGADKTDERQSYRLREQEYFLDDFSVIFPVQPGPLVGAPATVQISRLDELTTPYEFEITVSGVVEDHGILAP
jgi:type II secretory pathway pseudopilin PulG